MRLGYLRRVFLVLTGLLVLSSGAVAPAFGAAVRVLPGPATDGAAPPVVRWWTVQPGQTLAGIAARAYGSAGDWPALWWINRHAVPDPAIVRAGVRLRLSGWHPDPPAWLTRAARAAFPHPAPAPSRASSAGVSTGTSNPPPVPVTTYDGGGIWQCIAEHESGGDWSIDTGNGYFGGLQFTASTWLGYGGGVYAATANLATPGEQITVAERVVAGQGWGAWPVSSVACGAGGGSTETTTAVLLAYHRPRWRDRLVAWQWALTQASKPYVWGGTGPGGYDCSGLVMEAYRHAGVTLPRTTWGMLASPLLQRVAVPKRGDLAFYGTGHVELYASGSSYAGWTFGAHDTGTLISRIRYDAGWGWAPTAFYRVL